MATIVNSTPNASVKVPCTKYTITKSIQPIFTLNFCIKCEGCSNYFYSSTNTTHCETCNVTIKTTNSYYFIHIPFKEQLENSIKCNIEEILEYNSTALRNQNQITDVHNAQIYKNVQKKFPMHILLPLVVNTDGAKVFKSCSDSLWMIQMYQCFITPRHRYLPKNIIVVSAHFGSKKPKMTDFFCPLLRELREIQDANGIIFKHNGQSYNFMPFILSACCDLPAKADLQGMTGHSGRYACSYCFHPGVSIKSGESKKKMIRYVKGQYELRTHSQLIDTYSRLESNSINGVKTISCMIAARDFDLIHCFAIDHMHAAELGIMKKMMCLWLDSENHKEPYYIKKSMQTILSNRIVGIKPVTDILRKPKSIFSKSEYKANEYRSMLLFFLPHALPGLLNHKYVQHFRLFSSAMYLLLKEKVTYDDIETAQLKLNQFVDSFQELYGTHNVTLNLHLLRHLPLAVTNLGPLWSQSAYGFETNNGVILKSNTSKRNILHQIGWNYITKCSLKPDSDSKNAVEFAIGKKKTIKISAAESQLLMEEGIHTDTASSLTIHTDIVLRGVKYTTLESREISTIDFFIQLKDDSFAAIKYFIVREFILYALVSVYENDYTHDHFTEIRKTDVQKIIRMPDISKKALYIKFGQREFVTTFPNRYEKT